MSWASRAAKNLLPLSDEKYDLKEALKEWLYTGEMNDLEEAEEICQLCDHPNIRYQFLIENYNNNNTLWIGSECVTKFSIHAKDESGRILDLDETREKVSKDRRKLITNAKEKRMFNSLIELAKIDEKFNKIESFVSYYKERKAFTPNQLAFLIWRLDENHIDYVKSDFKMVIKRDREKQQLKEMPEWKINKILKCMSTAQKEFCSKNNLIQD